VGNGLDEARLKGWIMGEDWQVFEFGLGHEHSIEGIPMGDRKVSGTEGVESSDGKFCKPGFF